MVSACILLGWVSLLKSQSRFLIQKRIFRSFTKIQRQIIDPKDPQWRWILKRVNSASGNSKQFWYIHQLFDHTAHLYSSMNPIHGLMYNQFFSFYRGSKIVIQNWRTFIFLFTRTNATQLHQRILQDVTFPVHILLQDSSSFGQSKAVSLS